jgi:hypothetical protein
MSLGYVYVLTNRSFSEIKIGSTFRTPYERAAELSGTSLPHPFEVAYSVYINDPVTLEKGLHSLLIQWRVSCKREFFDMTVEEAIAVIDKYIKWSKNPWAPWQHIQTFPISRPSRGQKTFSFSDPIPRTHCVVIPDGG